MTRARKAIAADLGVSPNEILFTSSASEANNLAIKGIAKARKKGHIISITTEHKCVLNALGTLAKQGYSITLLPVDERGIVETERIKKAIRPDTILVSAMYGNNETGSIHAIEDIAAVTSLHSIPLHCDATQSIGHIAIRPADIGIDVLTFSGHKLYGPKGIGCAYIARHLVEDNCIHAIIDGGGQERGLRGGTLNVPGIVGLHHALALLKDLRIPECERTRVMRTEFIETICSSANVVINTPLNQALPHCINMSFPGINGQSMLQALGALAISSGSACNTGSQQPSHVLSAMGIAPELIKSSLRLSIGRTTTGDDMRIAAEAILAYLSNAQRS